MAAGLRWVGTYATRMPFCNNRVGLLKRRDGRAQVYGVTYSTEGKSAAFLVDPATGECEKFLLGDEKGAYGDEAGADGRLYLGTFKGRLLALDPDAAAPVTLLDEGFPGEMCWGGYMSRHGLFFFGMTPSGSFGVWDVGRAELVHKEVGAFGEGSHYAREFLDLPDGTVLVCVTGPDVQFARFDPASRRMSAWVKPLALAGSDHLVGLHLVGDEIVMRDFPSEELVFLDWRDLSLRRRVAAPGRVVKVLHGNRVLTNDPIEGALFEVTGGTWRKLGVPVPLEGGEFVALDERTIAGITEDGTFFRFDLETGERFTRVLPTEETNGMYATALAADGAGAVYIASYINQHLIRMQLETGASEDVGKVAAHIGQMTAMRWLHGKLYAAFYIRAGLICYDPRRPYEILQNPRVLGFAGEEQNRPLGRLEYDGRHLYVATIAHYGDLGGAIVRLDPASGEITTFRHVIPDQNLTGVVHDPVSGLLFVAGTIEGDQGTTVPRTSEAEWAAWDPRTQRRVGGGKLGAGVRTANLLEATGTGLVIGHHDRGFFAIRTSDLSLSDGPAPPAWTVPTNVMVRASDGILYGLGGGKLYRWDPRTGEAAALADAVGRCIVEAEPGRLVFNTLARVAEYRL